MLNVKGEPEAIAVLDVGKTNVKLLAIAPDGSVLSSRTAPNVNAGGDPYPHADVEHVWRWLMAALGDLGERYRIQAIVPTTHGSAAALVDETELVLPVLDYEAEPPREVASAYAEVAPWFEECCCPILPGGMTLARQLFWQSRVFDEAFRRTRWLLTYPQYWAWRLSGVPASEVTSLGAHSQLWNPRQRDFSGLAKREGWSTLLPPLRNAWDVLGPLQPEAADRCELPADVPVLCGIHDSNANLARYLAAGLDDFALISTGTWLITFNPGLPLDQLDPLRDTVANTDLMGRPVASARFMGGREYMLVAGESDAPATADDVARLVARGTMALPSFTDSGGPYPSTGGKGRIVGPKPTASAEPVALATLYVALMASVGLDLLQARGRIVVDGSFADNRLFTGLLAALRPDQPVLVSRAIEGTALGAGMLVGWSSRTEPLALDLETAAPLEVPGLGTYVERWHAAAETAASG